MIKHSWSYSSSKCGKFRYVGFDNNWTSVQKEKRIGYKSLKIFILQLESGREFDIIKRNYGIIVD